MSALWQSALTALHSFFLPSLVAHARRLPAPALHATARTNARHPRHGVQGRAALHSGHGAAQPGRRIQRAARPRPQCRARARPHGGCQLADIYVYQIHTQLAYLCAYMIGGARSGGWRCGLQGCYIKRGEPRLRTVLPFFPGPNFSAAAGCCHWGRLGGSAQPARPARSLSNLKLPRSEAHGCGPVPPAAPPVQVALPGEGTREEKEAIVKPLRDLDPVHVRAEAAACAPYACRGPPCACDCKGSAWLAQCLRQGGAPLGCLPLFALCDSPRLLSLSRCLGTVPACRIRWARPPGGRPRTRRGRPSTR